METLGPLASFVKPSVRNLEVTLDPALTLDAHVESLIRSCFYHLENIAKLSRTVSRSEMEIIIHAFISSHLDYCNFIFTCLSMFMFMPLADAFIQSDLQVSR